MISAGEQMAICVWESEELRDLEMGYQTQLLGTKILIEMFSPQ